MHAREMCELRIEKITFFRDKKLKKEKTGTRRVLWRHREKVNKSREKVLVDAGKIFFDKKYRFLEMRLMCLPIAGGLSLLISDSARPN